MLDFITLSNLPPVAPYSHAVRAGDFLFVTGQLSEDPTTGDVIADEIEAQTHRVMKNLKMVLAETGSSLEQVVMARIFITDFRDYETVNAIYQSYFTAGRYPGRTTVGVAALAGQGNIEIDLIAYCGGSS
ncbi:enamine deaminase RidA [filamentous cyanobacterium CCP5]|nr:enamine deaminase RidA [filamentous cyanobacterium CCP5]